MSGQTRCSYCLNAGLPKSRSGKLGFTLNELCGSGVGRWSMMGIMASLTKAATGAGVSLEIARQTAIATDPGQRALDDPALGQDDEFVQFVALDDLDHPMAGSGCGLRDAWSMIAGMSEGALDEGKEAASAPIENQPRPVAV